MSQHKYVRGGMKTAAVLGIAVLAGLAGMGTAQAQKSVKVGISLPLTGADAEDAVHIKNGAVMAIDEANAANTIPGYKIETVVYDSGTATAGQYDPAQAATNTKKLVADPGVVANVGPQMSGEGKAIYFRTVTTDAYQGPNMANWMHDKLKIKTVYVLDDSGAYGVGIADSFQAQATKIGIKVLGRDQLNPKEADYTTVLTKIKALKPDALYYGGVGQAGVKLAKQAYDVIPGMIKAGGDGMQGQSILKGVGFPAVEGWYATNASPHVTEDPAAADWVKRYKAKFNNAPYDDYTITAYDAALVVIDAIKRVVATGGAPNRDTVRDAMQAAKVKTIQGELSFDANGDLLTKGVSVFQYHENKAAPADSLDAQAPYIG